MLLLQPPLPLLLVPWVLPLPRLYFYHYQCCYNDYHCHYHHHCCYSSYYPHNFLVYYYSL